MENNYITFSKPPVLYPIMFTATRSPSFKVGSIDSPLIVYGVTINLPTINKMTKATAIEIIHSNNSFSILTPLLRFELNRPF